MWHIKRQAALMALACLLNGCALTPTYQPPALPQGTHALQFKEVKGWVNATPADEAPRGKWWAVFHNPQLDVLEEQLAAQNPTLAVAVARYDQARAIAAQAHSRQLPILTANADLSRTRLSSARLFGSSSATYDQQDIGLALNYEIDLWGRARNTARAARADADASLGDRTAAQLALQAQMATSYFMLRGDDAELALLQRTIASYQRAYNLVYIRHNGGIASGLDLSRAQAQLATARVQLEEVSADRDLQMHSIAALAGLVPADLEIAPSSNYAPLPHLPASTPALLLQRRPDIAAAERRIYAANARIGVAKAALFPAITLGGSGGFLTTQGGLLSASNNFWALGPLSALGTLFDAGRNKAQIRLAHAIFDEAAAHYRETVISAFHEVEDNLSNLHWLANALTDQQEAAQAAAKTRDLAEYRYKAGAATYLDVSAAQSAALDAERNTIKLHTKQLLMTIALIRACGGDYA